MLDGTMDLEVDGEIYRIPNGSSVEVAPMKKHQLRCAGKEGMTVLAIKWT
jgi:mannose-6-phosphate isomerase-like protein (cupin superfamily)